MGQDAIVTIISLIPFVCKGCMNVFRLEEFFSPNPALCNLCFVPKSELKTIKLKGKKKR